MHRPSRVYAGETKRERNESTRASKYGEIVRIRMQHPRRVDVYSFARQFSKRSRRGALVIISRSKLHAIRVKRYITTVQSE